MIVTLIIAAWVAFVYLFFKIRKFAKETDNIIDRDWIDIEDDGIEVN